MRSFWSRGGDEASMLAAEKFALAPMIKVTDRYFRLGVRVLSKRMAVYTQMKSIPQLVRDRGQVAQLRRALDVARGHEGPLVLQLGGRGADDARVAAQAVFRDFPGEFPYHAVNLNCGCPSPRVATSGAFGAALMMEPDVVRDMAAGMREVLPDDVPVSVKCRVGVDDHDSYEFLHRFVETVASTGAVGHFVIHARCCLLKGLSPTQNRTVPPLQPERVAQLVSDFPHLRFTYNGEVRSAQQANAKMAELGAHGAMAGRAFQDDPFTFANVDTDVFGEESNPCETRSEALLAYNDILAQLVEKEGEYVPPPKVSVKRRRGRGKKSVAKKRQGPTAEEAAMVRRSMALRIVPSFLGGFRGAKPLRLEFAALLRDPKVKTLDVIPRVVRLLEGVEAENARWVAEKVDSGEQQCSV